MKAKDFLNDAGLIKGWLVLAKPHCPWCERVEELLQKRGLPYLHVDISKCEEIKVDLKRKGLTTVPQVFFNGDHIGGYENTFNYLEEWMDQ